MAFVVGSGHVSGEARCGSRAAAVRGGWKDAAVAVYARRARAHARCVRVSMEVSGLEQQEKEELVSPQRAQDCAPVPLSFEAAVEQMRDAVQRALDQGYTRLLVEVDTTVGDETYTALKNSIPLVKAAAQLLSEGQVDFGNTAEAQPGSAASSSASSANRERSVSQKGGNLFEVASGAEGESEPAVRARIVRVVLPDSGAAALLLRDWEKEGQDMSSLRIVGFENMLPAEDDEAFIIAVPRASEVEQLERFVNEAAPMFSSKARPTIIINPDFVDMGVTGLGLAARQLRSRFLSTLESAFYLKSLPWGILIRAYPRLWAVYQDDPTVESQFRLIAAQQTRPSSDELEEFLDAANPELAEKGGGGLFSKLGKFLQMYMKG
ncbi:hypothetical protein FVE85_1067 [Porphyridium purpureum]|uniref:DUF1995 domain-containing protein n=1 Tax=Porphyridium purpureum TaxID=35688 RepID=A0A5J4Z1Z3_PORPP|nr:hypothetical protein FVE85_1067 [Porphyridium purpureum]|eukprot:POR3901..scf208_2